MSSQKIRSKDPLMGASAHRYSEVSPSDSSDDVVWDIDLSSKRRWLSKHRHLVPFVVHTILIILYTAIFAVVYSNLKAAGSKDELGISYVKQVFEVKPALNESVARIYTGQPSEELDAAWERLLKYSNIRVPEEEIRRLGRLDESVHFTDGSGYFGQMTMFHHLHCIMRVHHFLHVEHYWPNATADDMYLLRAHNFHCLDTLRQAVMCQGDTSLITFRWGETQRIPLGNFSSEHRCKSWDALDAWNKEHFVDVFQPGLVVHPKFGPSYGGESTTHGTGVIVEEGKIENGLGKIGGRHHKGVDPADGEMEGVKAKEKMELAWSKEKRHDEQDDDGEGRKGKVAAGVPWKRDAKPPAKGDVRPPPLPWKREPKPPVKVARAQAPDKWEDPLPPIDW